MRKIKRMIMIMKRIKSTIKIKSRIEQAKTFWSYP